MPAYSTIRSGCAITASTIRRSLTSGNERNDESRKAMTKRPGAPMLRAKASIHAVMRAIELQYSSPDVTDRFPRLLASIALVTGCGVALFYYQQGLTLSHYDAKAHLVVARRVLDSLTPEYSQIGAVWLPLPHLLNLLPVQIDWLYRTGASGVAISVVSFAVACYAIAHIVLRVSGSRVASAVAVAMFALDPDVLYLQSTPMTEPL